MTLKESVVKSLEDINDITNYLYITLFDNETEDCSALYQKNIF
jgi:hypothetical protein